MLIIPISDIETLKQTWVKILLSRTDNVTKVSDGSTLNAISYASAKLAQKSIKDIALAQSYFYPDTAYGSNLDNIANMLGVSPRFAANSSTTYVRVVGSPGTVYSAGTQVFSSSNTGIQFNLLETVTLDNNGYAYLQVQSTTQGSNTAVPAFSIDTVTPIPLGHQYCTNEFMAVGGVDNEDDVLFRQRIKYQLNVISTGTLAMTEQVFLKYNQNVLRVFNYGSDGNGNVLLGIATQDGSNLSSGDLSTLSSKSVQYLSMHDQNPDGLSTIATGVVLQNINWEAINISMRIEIAVGYNIDSIRTEMQILFNKYVDYRLWEPGDTIIWGDLYVLAKQVPGVIYINDLYFLIQGINFDYVTSLGKLPRFKSFQLLDTNGNIISANSGNLQPVFWPAAPDSNIQQSILMSLT